MKVAILYFDGCPNHAAAIDRIREVLRQEGISAEVSEVKVADEATARSIGFLGSPSIRINGRDLEPAARSSKAFGMTCRTYLEEGKRIGLPSRESIRVALRETAQSQPAPGQNRINPSRGVVEKSSEKA